MFFQEQPPHHGEQNPAHAEKGGLESEHSHHQREEGPDQLRDFKVK